MTMLAYEPPKTMTEDGFRRYEKGVDEYKNTRVIQGPKCCGGGIRSYGSNSGGVVFIGISPARDEVTRSGRPLTGPSGQLLNACLEAVNLKRQDYYCTNMVCTWMNDPEKEDINQCSARLKYELLTLKPKLIVLLGKLVTENYYGRPFGKVRGAVEWSEEYNCYVMGTYHPSAILHGLNDFGSSKDNKASDFATDFLRDLKKDT